MTALLETKGVGRYFGPLRALSEVSIAIQADELVSVVGPNGAGKTTLVNLLTGLLTPTAGEVLFRGESIAGIGPVRLAERGLVRSFQLIQIFPTLTVGETIAAAVVSQQRKRWRLFARLTSDQAIGMRVTEVAEIFDLRHRRWARLPRRCRRGKRNCSTWPRPSRSIRASSCSTSRPPASPPPRSTASCAP